MLSVVWTSWRTSTSMLKHFALVSLQHLYFYSVTTSIATHLFTINTTINAIAIFQRWVGVVSFVCVCACVQGSTSLKIWPKLTIFHFTSRTASFPMFKMCISKGQSRLSAAHIFHPDLFYKLQNLRIKWLGLFSDPVLCIRKLYKWAPRFPLL